MCIRTAWTACWTPPLVSDSVGLGWDLRMCIADNFPRATDAAGLGTTLWDQLPTAAVGRRKPLPPPLTFVILVVGRILEGR